MVMPRGGRLAAATGAGAEAGAGVTIDPGARLRVISNPPEEEGAIFAPIPVGADIV